jgi:hypothetical protein
VYTYAYVCHIHLHYIFTHLEHSDCYIYHVLKHLIILNLATECINGFRMILRINSDYLFIQHLLSDCCNGCTLKMATVYFSETFVSTYSPYVVTTQKTNIDNVSTMRTSNTTKPVAGATEVQTWV